VSKFNHLSHHRFADWLSIDFLAMTGAAYQSAIEEYVIAIQ
jgi:hypothetical protein